MVGMDPIFSGNLLAVSSLCQWPGMALGLLGAVLVAGTDRKRRRWGFALWVGSNAFWIVNAVGSGTWGLVIMQICFLATSGLGWWNHRAPATATLA